MDAEWKPSSSSGETTLPQHGTGPASAVKAKAALRAFKKSLRENRIASNPGPFFVFSADVLKSILESTKKPGHATSKLESMPSDILLMIFETLSLVDRFNLALASKALASLASYNNHALLTPANSNEQWEAALELSDEKIGKISLLNNIGMEQTHLQCQLCKKVIESDNVYYFHLAQVMGFTRGCYTLEMQDVVLKHYQDTYGGRGLHEWHLADGETEQSVLAKVAEKSASEQKWIEWRMGRVLRELRSRNGPS